MPQKISIVIVGVSHRDPAPIKLLLQQLTTCVQHQVAVVSCYETPSDRTLEKFRQESANLPAFQAIYHHAKMQAIIRKDAHHQKPYFYAEDAAAIEAVLPEILAEHFSRESTALYSIQPWMITRFAKSLLNYLAVCETETYHQMLYINDIPFQGIDRPSMVNEAFNNTLAATGNYGIFENQEMVRIRHMSEKVYVDAIKKLNGKDGLIVCQTGYMHAQRLASAILSRHKQQPAAESHYAIEVLPMCCYSNYSDDLVPAAKSEIARMATSDSDALKSIYATFKTPLVQITENPNYYAFHSAGFDHVLARALAHCAPVKIPMDLSTLENSDATIFADDDFGAKPTTCPCPCTVL